MDAKLKTYDDFDEPETSNARNSFQQYLLEFCKATKLYGFNYFAQPRTNKLEKFYWCIFIFVGFYFSVTMVRDSLTHWYYSPSVVLIHYTKPIWDVPFPAVTICPDTRIRESVYNFTDYYHKFRSKNITDEELEMFSDMSLFCDSHLYTSGNKTTNFEKVMQNLKNVSTELNKTMFSCKWTNFRENCSNIFTPVVTEEGLCFTFNMLNRQEIYENLSEFIGDQDGTHSKDWTLSTGYTKKSTQDLFPRRILAPGYKNGFFLILTSYEKDLNSICRGPDQGFKVFLHQPDEIPTLSSPYFRANLNQDVVVTVEPKLEKTSESLRSFSPQKRGCFFPEERKLKLFKDYTQENCRVECVANFTLSTCGCVWFSLPHNSDVPTCGSGSKMCQFEAERHLPMREAEESEIPGNCNCLPACTSLSYNAKTSQMDFNWMKVIKAFKSDVTEVAGMHMTRLTIYVKNMKFSVYERNRNNNNDFLAHCGGLLAFFSGFSFFTLAELVYFFCLRIIYIIRQSRKYSFKG